MAEQQMHDADKEMLVALRRALIAAANAIARRYDLEERTDRART